MGARELGRLVLLTQWNQFGESNGGAILKNKLLYFGDYQGTLRNTGGGTLLRVPRGEGICETEGR